MYFEHWEIKDGQKLILSLSSLNFIFVRDPDINQIITKLMEKVNCYEYIKAGTWWGEAYYKDTWPFLWILEWFIVFEDEYLVKSWLGEGLGEQKMNTW